MRRLEELSPEVVGVVADIEGTLADAAFVEDVLLPYAREHLADWLRERGDDGEIAALVERLRREADEPQADADRLAALVDAHRDAGRASATLETLLGLLWQHGLERGDYSGDMDADAVAALQAWSDDRRALFVFASLPVTAQRRLLAYSDHGDLTTLFSGYFDARMGPRKKAASYRAIARELGEAPASLLFVSASGAALDAAAEAGWQTCWVARDDATRDKAEEHGGHPTVASFAEIELI